MIDSRFQQAPLPFVDEKNLKEDEHIEYDDEGRKYLCWHDLIDIRVPLFDDPSILHTKRIPLPMHHQAPRNILGAIDQYWWDRTRKRVYLSSGDHCRCCGAHKSEQPGWSKNIDAHELYDINYQTGEMKLKAIVPLCASGCHAGIHFGRLTAKYESGEIQPKTYYQTISYCNTVLAKAGLPPKNWDATVQDNIYSVPWNQWHLTLVIEGKEQKFYSLYKDQKDLEAHY